MMLLWGASVVYSKFELKRLTLTIMIILHAVLMHMLPRELALYIYIFTYFNIILML